MGVRNEELYELVEQLAGPDKETVVKFMEFLVEQSKQKGRTWEEIRSLEPDDEPLTQEELRQLGGKREYQTWEEVKHELEIQIDLP